jgi:RNA polymerase sigma-70 factor (ECF subfamily)
VKPSPHVANDNQSPLDEGAPTFERLYAEQFSFVWRCLRGLGVPDASIDDAAQDVFLVVHRQLAGFRGQSTVRTWLFGILRNVASNHRRSVRRREQPATEVRPTPSRPDEHAQDVQAAAFVRGFLEELDEKKRAVFVLGALEEMSMPEVAAALSIPLNTAYTRLRRAREDFERALAAHQGRKAP